VVAKQQPGDEANACQERQEVDEHPQGEPECQPQQRQGVAQGKHGGRHRRDPDRALRGLGDRLQGAHLQPGDGEQQADQRHARYRADRGQQQQGNILVSHGLRP
jgi:hypothetical protein